MDKAQAFRVVMDPDLAHDLLGPIDHPDDPDWLVTTPLHAPALLTHGLLPPEATPATTTPTDTATTTVLFTMGTETKLARIIQTAGSIHQPASVIIVGSTGTDPSATQVVTQAHVNTDGHVTDARGPAAAQFTGLRLQALPRDLAHEIYRVLRNARAPHQQARHTTEPDTTSSEDETAPAPVGAVASALTIPAQAPADSHTRRRPADAPATAPLTLRLLGPIEVHGPAGTIPVTGDKTAALLALLALHPRGRSIAQIADQAWDGLETTGTDATPIRSAIARARTLLRAACHDQPPGAELITAGPTGFKLNSNWITTDLAAYDHLEDAARRTTDPARRTELLQQAADLHRGELAEAIDDWDRDWLTAARATYDLQVSALAQELSANHLTLATDRSHRMGSLRGAAPFHGSRAS